MSFRSLQTRLVVFFGLLLITVQVIGFIAVQHVTTYNVLTQIDDHLNYSSTVFKRQLADNAKKFADGAKLLAADFGFREAVATHDQATVNSALRNLGQRIASHRVLLLDLEGYILADTRQPDRASTPRFPFMDLIEKAEQEDRAIGIVVLDKALYELVVVPILAPIPIAWISMAMPMDLKVVEQIRALLPKGLHVSLLYQNEGGIWTTVASTLPVQHSELLCDMATADLGRLMQIPNRIRFAEDDYVMRVIPLEGSRYSLNAVAVLQYSLAVALQPYHTLLLVLMGIAATGLVISLLGSGLIASSVTRPLRRLAHAALQIEQGDYNHVLLPKQGDEVGTLAAAFHHMTQGIAEREETIRYERDHDRLTGFLNRSAFERSLEDGLRLDQPLHVLLLGINRFVEINNTLGHELGDHLIAAVATRLRHAVADDMTVARLATAQFILLVPAAATQKADALAIQLLTLFDSSFEIDGILIDLSVQVGIASYPDHGMSAGLLIQRADIAMQLARHSDERYARYEPGRDPYSRKRLSLMSELRLALARDELTLFYQPKIDIARNRVSHVEALVRWFHPVHGLMPPGEFIALAEQTGSIQRLTAWALHQAIAQCRQWHDEGIDLRIALNLSVCDLLNRCLPEQIEEVLTAHRVSPEQIVLEITESAIMQDADRALGILRTLKERGFTLSIDDFGTGYSSLSYLKKFPVDELKIDKSFVLQLDQDADDEILVRSTIELGHNLNLKVIAEGVETQASLEILRRYECDMAQGYYFSRPLAVAALRQWLVTSPWGLGTR